MSLLLALIPLAIKLLELVIQKKADNAKAKAAMVELVKALQAIGVKNARSRFEAENQVDVINDILDNPPKPGV